MKNYFLFLFMLFLSLTANSQTTISETAPEFQKPKWLECGNSGSKEEDEIENRILYEYGAVYLSKVFDSRPDSKKIPCLFKSQADIDAFTKEFTQPPNKPILPGFFLQSEAEKSLEQVFKDLDGFQNVARTCNKTTTCVKNPILNDDWALRTLKQTQCNWLGLGKPDPNYVIECLQRDLSDYVFNINKIKDDGNPKNSKEPNDRPNMFKVAIPGGSQHHLGLAIDVNDGRNKMICDKKCEIALGQNGWFRTIPYDSYHFTYLGFLEFELPNKGLKKVRCGGINGFNYWIPKVLNYKRYKFMEVNCPEVK